MNEPPPRVPPKPRHLVIIKLDELTGISACYRPVQLRTNDLRTTPCRKCYPKGLPK